MILAGLSGKLGKRRESLRFFDNLSKMREIALISANLVPKTVKLHENDGNFSSFEEITNRMLT